MVDYNNIYHSIDISKKTYLITGGAGFIGSHIVNYLLSNNAKLVRVLDNFSTGNIQNIEKFKNYPNFELINGDIRDFKICEIATNDIDFISHQAALGSVPRSIEDPIVSNEVNINGFLNILIAAKNSKCKKFIYAASSSTYGDSTSLPKIENIVGKPLSPYAITKAVNEMYADVFSKIYNFNTIGLRYFNVFGPNQSVGNAYAAVIPKFCKNYLENTIPTIYGDGNTSRDFTFVENVVKANILAFETNFKNHEVFNIACGKEISLNDIIIMLNYITGNILVPNHLNERTGDIKHSLASLDKSIEILKYYPEVEFREGLQLTYNWYKNVNADQ